MRTVREIAAEIAADWTKPYFGAVPYLRAMHSLQSPADNYGFDNGRSIIRYFLGNAAHWRGPVARRIKAELKSMI